MTWDVPSGASSDAVRRNGHGWSRTVCCRFKRGHFTSRGSAAGTGRAAEQELPAKALARLRQRVRRFKRVGRTLNKLFTPNLQKALTFLDDRLLPATSNAVQRSKGRFRKAQRSVYSVRTAEHVRQRIALDMERDHGAPERNLTVSTLHRARANTGQPAPTMRQSPFAPDCNLSSYCFAIPKRRRRRCAAPAGGPSQRAHRGGPWRPPSLAVFSVATPATYTAPALSTTAAVIVPLVHGRR